MSSGNRSLVMLLSIPAVLTGASLALRGQQPAADTAAAPVVIKREAAQLRDPKSYHVPLQLRPVRAVELISPVDATVAAIESGPGEKLEAQTTVLRLMATEQQLELARAKALFRVAQLELAGAKKSGDADQAALAEARLEAAKADLDLATFRHERSVIRMPFAATVYRIHVVDGQFVRAGDTLVGVGDASRLQVEIPVDRNTTKAGQSLEIRIEDQTVQGSVKAVLPPAEKFEPLRELVDSVASALVEIDNAGGKFSAGQTVYAALVPRQPVTEIANSALINSEDGQRKVRVVRSGVVRHLPVTLRGAIGEERTVVSGPFESGDEVVTGSSQELPDGAQVRATTPTPAGTAAARPTPPKRSSAGF